MGGRGANMEQKVGRRQTWEKEAFTRIPQEATKVLQGDGRSQRMVHGLIAKFGIETATSPSKKTKKGNKGRIDGRNSK